MGLRWLSLAVVTTVCTIAAVPAGIALLFDSDLASNCQSIELLISHDLAAAISKGHVFWIGVYFVTTAVASTFAQKWRHRAALLLLAIPAHLYTVSVISEMARCSFDSHYSNTSIFMAVVFLTALSTIPVLFGAVIAYLPQFSKPVAR